MGVNPSCSVPRAPIADCELREVCFPPAVCMYVFVRAELYPVLFVYCQLLTTSPVL